MNLYQALRNKKTHKKLTPLAWVIVSSIIIAVIVCIVAIYKIFSTHIIYDTTQATRGEMKLK